MADIANVDFAKANLDNAGFDVAIVGGGLIGCATASYLAKAGARVILLEQGQINQGASGQNAGSLHFQLEHRLIQNLQVQQRELEFYVGIAKLSIEDWKNIDTELGCDNQLAMHGGLMVAESAEQTALLERKSHIEQSQGLSVNLLDGDQARKLAPYLADSVVAALHCPDEGHCNPRLLTPAFARRAIASGATIKTGTDVKAIERRGSGWRVIFQQSGSKTGSETASVAAINCGKILNAAGAGAPAIAVMANLHLPLFAVGLTMNATEKTAPVVNHLIQHVGRKLSLKQTEDGNLLIGGGWSAQLRQKHGEWAANESPQLLMDSVTGNLRTAAAVVPMVKSLRLLRSWTGTTCITADQLPVLGEFAQAPGFFVAAGGSGFTYGPTYARLMSELMLNGHSSYSLNPFNPARFAGLNAFMA
jgi:glycine/D-amino acid oxidase-like deaminating enzyme